VLVIIPIEIEQRPTYHAQLTVAIKLAFIKLQNKVNTRTK